MEHKIIRIEGTIRLSDGSVSAFIIGTDGGWQQWGASTERLGETGAAMEAMVAGLFDENLLASDDDDDDDDDEPECEGHPDDDHSIAAGMPSGETHYCDGSCRPRREAV